MRKDSRDKLIIMLSVLSGLFLSSLDQTIVATALPRIVAALGNMELLSWVVSAYLLSSTATVIIYGKLSDMHGRKKLFLLGIVIFLAGSVLSGLSQDIVQLIIFRALQGIGGGAIMVNAMAIIGDLFPPAERGRWQGLTGAVFAISSIAGPLLGGFITDYISWHWIFFINVPVGIFSIAILLKYLPHTKGHGGSVDWRGSAVLVAAVVLLMLGLLAGGNYHPWLSAQTVGLFALSALMFIAFARVEGKAAEPVLHPEIFGNRIFLVSIAVTFLAAMGMFGALVYIPLFAQAVLGMSAASSGLVMVPMALATVVGSTAAGQVMARTGKYRSIAIFGMGIMSLGMAMLAMLGPSSTEWDMVRDIALVGGGLGVTFPVFIIAVQNAFGHSRTGVVTSALQFFRSIGGLVGTTAFGAVMVSLLNAGLGGSIAVHGSPDALLSGMQGMRASDVALLRSALASSISGVFIAGALVSAAAFALSFFLRELPLRKAHIPLEVGVELAEEGGFFRPEDEPKE